MTCHFAVSTLIAQRAEVKLVQAIAGRSSATVALDAFGRLVTERATEAAGPVRPGHRHRSGAEG